MDKKITFDGQLKTAGDIKVPIHIRRLYSLEKNDWFHITIEKIVPRKQDVED